VLKRRREGDKPRLRRLRRKRTGNCIIERGY
jgi:hypothetical protein